VTFYQMMFHQMSFYTRHFVERKGELQLTKWQLGKPKLNLLTKCHPTDLSFVDSSEAALRGVQEQGCAAGQDLVVEAEAELVLTTHRRPHRNHGQNCWVIASEHDRERSGAL